MNAKTANCVRVMVLSFVVLISRAPDASVGLDLFGTVGYGFPIGGVNEVDGLSLTSQTVTGGVLVDKDDRYLNYGSGLKLDAGLILRFLENASIHFGIQYTAGIPKLETEEIDEADVETITVTRNTFGFQAVLAPGLPLGQSFTLYAGAGLGIRFAEVAVEVNTSPIEGDIETEAAPALVGLVGGEYRLNDRIGIVGEVGFEAVSFWVESLREPGDDDITSFDRNNTSRDFGTPPLIPGSNVSIRGGVVFHLF